jgi:multidrug efflux pump subunit AcrA (membrane-fusion protein)
MPRSATRRGDGSWLRAPLWFGLGAATALLLVSTGSLRVGPASPPPTVQPAVPTPVSQRLIARGQVRPIATARIGTLGGGTVNRLDVEVGSVVDEQQELARIRGPQGTEVVTAPWRGTITAVPARVGDTILAGATLAMLGDLSRLQVETTDVDEFIISQVRPGQAVTVRVDALDRRALNGRVRTVALLPETTATGDDHYPVVVEVGGSTADLRLGMTVRVNFGEEP